MSKVDLTQKEAEFLIKLEKHRKDEKTWIYPVCGKKISITLISYDKREYFLLDITSSRISLTKGTLQNRVKQNIILIRLDFGESTHRNPDQTIIKGPHLHMYKEGYEDKWAFQISSSNFSNINNRKQTLEDFIKYCNITIPPIIDTGLLL